MTRRKPAARASGPKHPSRPRRSPGAIQAESGATPKPSTSTPPDETEPQALVVTFWFDSGSGDHPYDARIRLNGKRLDSGRAAAQTETFVREERLEGIVPNTGRVAITVWVYDVPAGDWDVQAALFRDMEQAGTSRGRVRPEALSRAAWSWRRWDVSTVPAAPVATRWAVTAPLARIPAVAPGVWTVLGLVGVTLAIALLATIAGGRGIPVPTSLMTALAAVVVGLVAAKVWFAVLAPGPWYRALLGGWAVDGFLVAAPATAIGLLLAQGLPVGVFLDASAPGLFFAVAIGRVGCFVSGCCAGRMTSGRFGLWSSDRRVGARRVPVQLLESMAGLGIAAATGVLVAARPVMDGLVFAGAFVVYGVVRQVVLRLRAEARPFSWRRSGPSAARI